MLNSTTAPIWSSSRSYVPVTTYEFKDVYTQICLWVAVHPRELDNLPCISPGGNVEKFSA